MELLPAFVGAPEVGRVYHCDALTLLRAMPDNYVDIVVTSPPYNLGSTNRRGGGFFEEKAMRKIRDNFYVDGEDVSELDYQGWLSSVIAECLRVSKGLVWVNHKTRFREKKAIHPLSFLPYPVYSEIIWARAGSWMLNSKRFAQSHEYVYGFGEPHFWNDELNGKCTVWHIASVQNSSHACPFPEALVSPLVDASCPQSGIVLDPFMGSGTTAAVAIQLSRRFVGCDLSLEYCEMARTRIEKWRASGTQQGLTGIGRAAQDFLSMTPDDVPNRKTLPLFASAE